MKRSSERILTTHAGALPQPADLKQMHTAQISGQPVDQKALAKRVHEVVAQVVKKQLDCGLDIINDGEVGKSNFSRYARERLSGFIEREVKPEDRASTIYARDMVEFGDYFNKRTGNNRGDNIKRVFCNGPLKYVGQQGLQQEIGDFKAGLQGQKYEEAFLPAIAPGTIEHWMKNDYYPNDEAYLFAIADAMHEEYKAIVDAGFLLQIDDPDLPDGWQFMSRMSVPEYRKYAELRVDALNHGLRDIPPDKVRFHTCWGSYHGPAQIRHPTQRYRRSDFKSARRYHFYRSSQPKARARMAGVARSETTRRKSSRARRRRPCHRYRRTSAGDRRPAGALCQDRRPGKRHGRYRLWTWASRRRSANRLGKVRSHGRRRPHRDQGVVEKMSPFVCETTELPEGHRSHTTHTRGFGVLDVIPVKTGIQHSLNLDSRFRGSDKLSAHLTA